MKLVYPPPPPPPSLSTSLKWGYNIFYSRKCICRHCLQNVPHSVQTSMSQYHEIKMIKSNINKRPVGLSSFVNCPPVVASFLTQRQLSVIAGWQHMGRVPHPYYINPGYDLSLADTLWNASSYRQPLEQEGDPMTWIEKFWLQISLIVAKK